MRLSRLAWRVIVAYIALAVIGRSSLSLYLAAGLCHRFYPGRFRAVAN